jgi:LysM repeat protein
MRSVPFAFIVVLIGVAALPMASAQTPTTPDSPTEELKIIRQLLEQQSKQIETLTQQVTRLNQLLDEHKTIASVPSPIVTRDTPPVGEMGTVGAPPNAAPPPIPPQKTHVVAKGETLTAIAKHYNVTVAELMEANTVKDDRKLQIGQVLVLPPSASESSPPKPKEEP